MIRPPAQRLLALLAVMCLGLFGILARLSVLQVRKSDAYAEMALQQRLDRVPLAASRGAILDRDGQDLALSLQAAAVYANPGYVRDPLGTATQLAEVLGVGPRELLGGLSSDAPFVYLSRQVDRGVARRVDDLGLPGIGLLEETKRYYPGGEAVAPQVLGFVGIDGQGLSGLEYRYEEILSGTPGERVVEIDPAGRFIPQGSFNDRPPVRGHDLVTTIDADLQFQAQMALSRAVHRNHARGGTVIVLDARNSEVLAMATYPWFDPNQLLELSARDIDQRGRNRAVTDVYEPGSTSKVITVAAMIEEGLIGAGETLMVPDEWRVADSLFSDPHRHAAQPMTPADILAWSSNVGTIRLAERLGSENLARYLARFGFGQETEVGFPGESEGILPPLFEWSGTSLPSFAIGTGMAVTPLQMAAVYATIAGGGVWTQPRLVRGTVDPGGTFQASPPPASRQVVSPRTAEILTRMLHHAVAAGTGEAARISGYPVAGKTGTARKPLPDRAGYSETRFVASFFGFLPAGDPRVVIGVMIDEPETVYGAIAAAPLFREVARHAIGQLHIAPGAPPPAAPHLLPLP
jgi:cell division protein FtsI (penicillin-binding protein 3)